MTTGREVAKCLYHRMRRDKSVAERLAEAGALWKEVPLRFYFGDDGDTIDIVVAEAEMASISPLDLPEVVWSALLASIGPSTLVKEAIDTMWLATLGAR